MVGRLGMVTPALRSPCVSGGRFRRTSGGSLSRCGESGPGQGGASNAAVARARPGSGNRGRGCPPPPPSPALLVMRDAGGGASE